MKAEAREAPTLGLALEQLPADGVRLRLSSSHCADACISPSQQQEAPERNDGERQLDSTVKN